MNNILILLAAGNSSRLNIKEKKQYIYVKNRPLVCFSLDTFLNTKQFDKIILVIGKNDEKEEAVSFIKKEYDTLIKNDMLNVITGGEERYSSVYNGLKYINENVKNKNNLNVIIHDAARPFVKENDIKNLIEILKLKRIASLAYKEVNTVKLAVKVKISDKDLYEVKKTLDRNQIFNIATPQGFDFNILYNIYIKYIKSQVKIPVTDDLQMIENYSKNKVYLILGSSDNIKITTKEDLKLLKNL